MFVSEKEQKIRKAIQESTGIDIDIDQQANFDFIKNFRSYKIKKILLVSSSYNFFQLEEEGRLNNLFSEYRSYDSADDCPEIVHVESKEQCLKKLKNEHFDLILLFNKTENIDITNLSNKIKKITTSPIILLGNDINDLSETYSKNKNNIFKAFTWNGDGKIILSIVQYYEDYKNLQISSSVDNKRCILLIEDSIQHYSGYLLLIYEEINNYLKHIINENLTKEQRALRYKRRPFVIHADNYEKAKRKFERYKDNLICVITDNYIEHGKTKKQIGLKIAKKSIEYNSQLPVLIQSSGPLDKDKIENKGINFISKSSHNHRNFIKNFIKNCLGSYEIILKNEKGNELTTIKNIKSLEQSIKNIKSDIFFKYAKKNTFSNWLKNIGEIELSNKCHTLEQKTKNGDDFKDQMLNIIEDYKYSINQSDVTKYSRKSDDPLVKLSKISEGALGGKARGIAFIAKMLSKYITEDMFPKLKITIPRSIVLSTDVFDLFMDNNRLSDLDFTHLSDQRIASKFMKASLPASILGDLRSFIKKSRKPLIVRSSGLLEDSLMQPFAGIYESVIFPNESWEEDVRFQEVCNSIKYVYASTYFEKARTYIKNTPKHMGDEKMAILIQEVVGLKHENYFYPTISGVAKSYNYYPSGPCKPEEGIVYLALGLGKAIVDGGSSYAFCPERPKVPIFGTPKEYMKYAQTNFYSLNLKSIYRYANFDEKVALETLDIDDAKRHGVLNKVVSTYIPQDDQIYPGIYEDGYLVVDFGPIISYEEIPLAKAIKLLLKISEIALGYPVEIEFAVNLPKDENKQAELFILQIRNMIPFEKEVNFDINKISKEKILIYSENALGNGIHKKIKDVVYIDQKYFDLSNSNQVVNQIKKLNSKLMEENKPYILIGPGRWGSTDPWLGIPVIWSDIAGAKVIVETPYKERHIDPSQGSHFFHDMIASQVLYLIIKKDENINWEWFKKQKIIDKTEFIKHIETQKPLKTIVDGRIGKGVTVK